MIKVNLSTIGEDIRKLVGKRIEQRIKALGFTIRSFSQAHGFTASTLYGYVNGTNFPDPEIFLRLARKLDTTRAFLLGETDDPSKLIGNSGNSNLEGLLAEVRETNRLLAQMLAATESHAAAIKSHYERLANVDERLAHVERSIKYLGEPGAPRVEKAV